VKYWIGCLAVVCLFATGAQAGPVFAYFNNRDGATAPAVSATPLFNGLTTGWIFGEVSVDPSWVGQPMFGDILRIQNTTPNPVDVGLMIGVWAADGPGGGPGTLLDGTTHTNQILSMPPGNTSGIIVYTGWPVPAGDFWMGYAFETFGASTTAAELNGLLFDLGDAPTVGASSRQALLGNQIGFIGSNPTIAGEAGNFLSQSIQIFVADTPEPSAMVLMGGGLILVGVSRRRRFGFGRRRKG
jgi:hypothetical protein